MLFELCQQCPEFSISLPKNVFVKRHKSPTRSFKFRQLSIPFCHLKQSKSTRKNKGRKMVNAFWILATDFSNVLPFIRSGLICQRPTGPQRKLPHPHRHKVVRFYSVSYSFTLLETNSKLAVFIKIREFFNNPLAFVIKRSFQLNMNH